MARAKNDVSPRVASRLAEIAREMRQLVYGEEGCPEWGTRFSQIEASGMGIGHELARLFMQQAVADQAAGPVPPAALDCGGETAKPLGTARQTLLETPAGDVEWPQPVARLEESRRDFFPSGQSAGGGC